MLSIQQRLTLVLGAGVLLLWSLGGVALYWVGRAGLVAQLDNAIEINAQALATCLEYKKNGFKIDLAREFMPPFERIDRPNYYQFWLPDGTPTVRSRSLRRYVPGEGQLLRPRLSYQGLVELLDQGREGNEFRVHGQESCLAPCQSEKRGRHRPSSVDLSNHVISWRCSTIKEHLVEFAHARHSSDGPDFHTRLIQIHQQKCISN